MTLLVTFWIPCTFLSWRLRHLFNEKRFPHKEHTNDRSRLWTTLWSFSADAVKKDFPQIIQADGFTGWISVPTKCKDLSCRRKLLQIENPRLHIVHLNGRSPLWTNIWRFRLKRRLKDWPQTVQAMGCFTYSLLCSKELDGKASFQAALSDLETSSGWALLLKVTIICPAIELECTFIKTVEVPWAMPLLLPFQNEKWLKLFSKMCFLGNVLEDY